MLLLAMRHGPVFQCVMPMTGLFLRAISRWPAPGVVQRCARNIKSPLKGKGHRAHRLQAKRCDGKLKVASLKMRGLP